MAMVGVVSGSLYMRTHSLKGILSRHNSTHLNWPSWTAYSQVSRVFVYDVTTYKLSQLLFTLWSSVALSCVAINGPLVVWLGLGSAAAWRHSTFIKWSRWTLALALPWWRNHKHCRDDDDDYYYNSRPRLVSTKHGTYGHEVTDPLELIKLWC